VSTAYERGFLGAQPASGVAGPLVCIRTGSLAIRLRTLEHWSQGTAAAGGRLELYRVSATGTPTTSGLGQAIDAADAASLTNLDTAWSVNPTLTGQPLRSRTISGNGNDWIFWHWHEQNGLVVPANSGLVLWRITTEAQLYPNNGGEIGWEE